MTSTTRASALVFAAFSAVPFAQAADAQQAPGVELVPDGPLVLVGRSRE